MRTLIAVLCFAFAAPVFAQGAPPAAKPAAAKPAAPEKMSVAMIMDRQLTSLENDFVPAAEAMPEDKFGFAPTQGEFKGVRTFALQVKHVAHTNLAIFSLMLGEKLPNFDPNEDNGPEKMTSKADIIKYLKDSFALGHRAMKTLTEATLTERLKDPSGGGNPGPSRLGAASVTLWHSFDHYGQMVEYLRMNGIVPPASRQQ
jgi:uncharacterized damage-inducible protein DinB